MNKKSIALICPKSTFLTNPIQWGPLGLFYLSSRLESLGHETDFFDLNFDELPADGDFDQLWISATTPQRKDVRRIIETVKHWTKTKIVFGGANAWDDPESCKEFNFDIIGSGEADSPENIQSVLDGVEKLPKNTKINLPVSTTLNWVIKPNRKWATKYQAFMYDENDVAYKMSSIFGSRGCPMTCSFCSSGRLGVIWDKFVRYEPLEVIEEQIKELSDLGFTGLAYYDDILVLHKPRTLKMMELHKKYNMKFRCFLRTDIICNQGGKEYLKALKDGGLIEIFVGVESGDNRIKENIYKKTTIEQDTAVLNWCKELGITFKGSFILGLPGESLESMEKTRQWILSKSPYKMRIQVDRLIPFPGTPIMKNPELYDLKWESRADDDYFYKGRSDLTIHSFVSTSNLSLEQIDDFYHKLNREIEEAGFRS